MVTATLSVFPAGEFTLQGPTPLSRPSEEDPITSPSTSPLTWYHHVVPSLVSVGVIAVGGSHLTEVLGLITTEE